MSEVKRKDCAHEEFLKKGERRVLEIEDGHECLD